MQEVEILLEDAFTPAQIEQRSFEIIDREIPAPRPFTGHLWEVARRCIHAVGDISLIDDLHLEESALLSGLEAMRNKCIIYTDTRMLAAGLVRRRMAPLGVKVISIMDLPNLDNLARERGETRAACGIREISNSLSGNIVAIGNAPTALLGLLRKLQEGAAPPALIVGMPVGFVNAAQSKQLLLKSHWPHFTLMGRKGGSAVAAACLNALAEIILREKQDLPDYP